MGTIIFLLKSNDNSHVEEEYKKYLSGDTKSTIEESIEKKNEALRQVRLRNNEEENKRYINEEIKKIKERINEREACIIHTDKLKKELEARNTKIKKNIDSIDTSL